MISSRSLRLGFGVLLAGGLLFGCTDDKKTPEKSAETGVDEVVPAGEPVEEPGTVLAVRYWVEIDPMAGKMDMFEIKPGNKINRVETQQQAIRYTYSGTATKDDCLPGNTCVPAANRVRTWTDQTKVSYHPIGGVFQGSCRQASTSYPRASCPNFPAGSTTCATDGVFCGPIQMVNNYPFALPNVVLRIRNPADGPTPVTACHEHGANTSFGRCQDTQTAKTDPSTSSLQPTISGCAYCYGNATNVDNYGTAQGVNMAGLKNVVLPTSAFNQNHWTLNTDMLAMQLANDNNAQLVLEVRYSVPSFNSTGELQLRDFASGNCLGASTAATCVIPGTTCAIIGGGGFGPPANCFAQLPGLPTGACQNNLHLAMGSVTTPFTGYSVQFPASGGTFVDGTGTLWTDNTIRTTIPAAMGVVAGNLRVVTPVLTSTLSSTAYTMCASTNSWRALSNGLPAGRIDPVGGVVGSGGSARIVVAGGRVTGNGTGDTGQVTTYLLPIPASQADSPSWTTMASYNMVAGRWGAAFAVHDADLYAFGGASGGNCLSSGERFDDGTLTWTATAAMPAAICQPRAVVSGQYIIVSGGATAAWTSFNDFDLLANTSTYVYDTTMNTWATYTAGGQFDPAERFAAASAGSIIVGGGNFVDASAVNSVSSVGGGAPPSFSGEVVTGLTARASSAAGLVSTGTPRYFLYGGIIGTADADTAATNQLWTATVAAPGAWSQPAGVGGSTPTARAGHVFVAATGGDGTVRVYAIGGHNAGSLVTSVDEYTPAP